MGKGLHATSNRGLTSLKKSPPWSSSAMNQEAQSTASSSESPERKALTEEQDLFGCKVKARLGLSLKSRVNKKDTCGEGNPPAQGPEPVLP